MSLSQELVTISLLRSSLLEARGSHLIYALF